MSDGRTKRDGGIAQNAVFLNRRLVLPSSIAGTDLLERDPPKASQRMGDRIVPQAQIQVCLIDEVRVLVLDVAFDRVELEPARRAERAFLKPALILPTDVEPDDAAFGFLRPLVAVVEDVGEARVARAPRRLGVIVPLDLVE